MTRHLRSALLLAVAALPAPVVAQAVPSTASTAGPVPGAADQLAAQMRLLAVNANDLTALLTAGELSVKLDDLGAAASFFARADRIDPHNGRAKAGEAAILVHAERPGESLRYFAQAESYGAAPASFAAERGLAYDLIGEQERAQRDYRLALRAAPDAAFEGETRRRYALSLAISGKRELSEQELRPLLRQSDRGAWRARAFALALGGDVAEAERIATTMMPPGTAAGLQPFLERLPTLGPVDRAFAVHFGEIRSTPERAADARKAPPLAALGPDPYAPRVAVAAVVPDKGKKRPDKKRGKPEPVQVAVATPAPEPLPQAPAYRAAAGGPPVLATRGAAPTAWPTSVRPDAPPPMRAAVRPPVAPTKAPAPSLAGTTTLATPGVEIAAAPRRTAPVLSRAPSLPPAPPPEANVTVAATAVPAKPVASSPSRQPSLSPEPVVTAAPSPVPAPPSVAIASTDRPAPAREPVATVASPAATSAPSLAAAESTATAPPAPEPLMATSVPPATAPAALPPPSAPAAEPSQAAATPIRTAPPIRHDDGALSRIVAGLPIPGAELGVVAPRRAFATPVAAEPATPAPIDLAAERAAEKAAADRAAAKALADKRAADKKALADRKALAEKKAAAAKKVEEEREAAAQRKIERANPERIWVQVAGGANPHDLHKAWSAAKAKGGDAFVGHATGWTTPLRFTNRVLAGPFKTGEEARAFVNKLKGIGMSTFTFTSDAGQVVTKLSAE